MCAFLGWTLIEEANWAMCLAPKRSTLKKRASSVFGSSSLQMAKFLAETLSSKMRCRTSGGSRQSGEVCEDQDESLSARLTTSEHAVRTCFTVPAVESLLGLGIRYGSSRKEGLVRVAH